MPLISLPLIFAIDDAAPLPRHADSLILLISFSDLPAFACQAPCLCCCQRFAIVADAIF